MKHFLVMMFFSVIISTLLYGQKDTVVVDGVYTPPIGREGTLNDAIQAKIDNGTLSNTVFKLRAYDFYVLTGTITTPPGAVLEIVADAPGNTQETAPPMIAWTTSTAPDKRFNFDIAGDVKMKNVWILYGDVAGAQSGTSLRVGDSSNVVGGVGGRAEFENVIFDHSLVPGSAAGAVEIYSTHFKGKFTNCYFRNCVDPHYRYYGRALSFRYSSTGLHADSVMFENCTFANMGYVYMQEGAEYGDNVHFNHCTFYNVVQFTLESGWWYKMSVTNSVFVNTQMYGAIPANDGEGFGGTINIAPIDSGARGNGFGFTVPFTEQDRRILFTNNSYFLDQWLVDWMRTNPYSDSLRKKREDDLMPMMNSNTIALFDSLDEQGNKVFPYRNYVDLYDNTDPSFKVPTLNLDSLKQFLYHKWSDNKDVDWTWHKEDYNPNNQLWPLEEDFSYTNTTLQTAGMGSFPLGDLYRWWPNEYAQWKSQADQEKTLIFDRLKNGITDVKEQTGIAVPLEYTLSQNYPNPFNPITQIEYSVPKDGYVSLKVYNDLGQEVVDLFSGIQRTGNYKATFDGTGLASGVYFYKLQSENVSITKKLVLMK